MPRPRKCRQVCNFPQTLAFLPEEYGEEQQAVRLTVDEYETIRLIDKEGFSQEQCGEFMKIARATVQQIYASARKKLADMLIEARTSDAEMEFLEKDEEYQKRREKSLQQDKILKSMNPPKDIMDQVDLLTCSINDCWSRYADLIYQYALEDILAFLIERQGL